jgi:hypothetical protein
MGIEPLQSGAVPVILSKPRSQNRKKLRKLLAGALVLWVASCGRAKSGQTGSATPDVPEAPRAEAPATRVRLFLIAPGDNGRAGRRVACNDSAVPVEVPLPQPEPGLAGALRALLALKERYQTSSGLYNPLYASTLDLVRIERQGADARVYLKGYLELADACDDRRLLAELQETALQFADVQHAQFYVGDRPLQEILGGKR